MSIDRKKIANREAVRDSFASVGEEEFREICDDALRDALEVNHRLGALGGLTEQKPALGGLTGSDP